MLIMLPVVTEHTYCRGTPERWRDAKVSQLPMQTS